MAHGVYVPVQSGGQSISKAVTDIYAPVEENGQYVSKRVIKGYCPVNGVSKIFWDRTGIRVTVKTRIYDAYSSGGINVTVTTSIKNYTP